MGWVYFCIQSCSAPAAYISINFVYKGVTHLSSCAVNDGEKVKLMTTFTNVRNIAKEKQGLLVKFITLTKRLTRSLQISFQFPVILILIFSYSFCKDAWRLVYLPYGGTFLRQRLQEFPNDDCIDWILIFNCWHRKKWLSSLLVETGHSPSAVAVSSQELVQRRSQH